MSFSLPPGSRRGKKPPLSKGGIHQRIGDTERDPARWLRDFVRLGRDVNRYRLPAPRRLAAAMHMLRVWVPAYFRAVGRFAKSGGIPDPDDRAEQLDLLAEAARVLAVSFQLVLQRSYEGSRFHYAHHRDRVYFCAFRVLELIKLEQRVRGLRYWDLDARTWQDAHTVFHVMHAYESVDFPLPVLETLHPERKVHTVDTLHGLYAAIQAFAIIDFRRWPVHYQSFIDTYLNEVDEPIVVAPGGGGVGGATFVARCYQPGPPLRENPSERQGPAVKINCSVLFAGIRDDYRDLLRATQENNPFLLPRKLVALTEDFRFLIARMMLDHVSFRPGGDPAAGTRPAADGALSVYSGLKDVHTYLNNLFRGTRSEQAQGSLGDILARRSALIGEDHTAAVESRWHVIRQHGDGSVRLRTQETRFTVGMRIGSLLAYGFGEGIRRPRLATVARIARPDARVVEVDLDHVADYAEPVKLYKSVDEGIGGADKTRPIGGLLVYIAQIGWRLLVASKAPFREGSAVTMARARNRYPITLGASRAASAALFLYRVDLGRKVLGRPAYPVDRPTRSDAAGAAGQAPGSQWDAWRSNASG